MQSPTLPGPAHGRHHQYLQQAAPAVSPAAQRLGQAFQEGVLFLHTPSRADAPIPHMHSVEKPLWAVKSAKNTSLIVHTKAVTDRKRLAASPFLHFLLVSLI